MKRAKEIFAFLDGEYSMGMNPFIIDAGANIGASAVYFALAFPHALIVAIEPEEENFRLLKQNTVGLRVHCVQAALASSQGNAKVIDPGEGHWGYRTEAVGAGPGVPCVTIPEIFEMARPRFPFIVKIDIEGAESDVFARNTSWVARTRSSSSSCTIG
jgi:FkbM family methyltransferase